MEFSNQKEKIIETFKTFSTKQEKSKIFSDEKEISFPLECNQNKVLFNQKCSLNNFAFHSLTQSQCTIEQLQINEDDYCNNQTTKDCVKSITTKQENGKNFVLNFIFLDQFSNKISFDSPICKKFEVFDLSVDQRRQCGYFCFSDLQVFFEEDGKSSCSYLPQKETSELLKIMVAETFCVNDGK